MGIILVSLLLRYCVSSVEGSCSSGSAGRCDVCLSQGPRCAWCSQENFPVGKRCDTPEVLLENGCLRDHLEFHVSHSEVLLDGPLGRGTGTANGTQISPQRMALNLRPGSPMNFQVRVQQTEDYPVDIYYLMDLSASMTDDLETIKDLGSTLTREMSRLTTKSADDQCLPTFGYKHVLSLTNNTGAFNDIISKQRVSANVDLPECGFDAIMQVAVCGDKIGWRNDSMRLLVFTSDADSHFGMDSRMAGIVVPNDMRCHLDDNNDYSMSTVLEYPTLGQLIDKLVENNILPIFAVTKNQKHIYESDSRNILELIVTAYKELRSEIELEVLGDTEDLQMSFTAICPDGGIHPGIRRCSSIKSGDTVVFNVSVELTSCLASPGRFLLRPVGFQDGLAGSPECGVCVCRPGFVGSQCECGEEDAAATSSSSGSGCRATGDEGAEPCGGQGDCSCGRCVCQPSVFGHVYGRFCECDDFSCVRSSTEACVSQDGTSCSGRGHCECGRCVCSAPGASGKLCEKCPTCGDTCSSARACVECHLQAKESLEMCVQRCSVPMITINASTELDPRHATQCTLKTDYDCFISFSIVTGELGTSAHNLHIYDCPQPPNITMIIVGVSLSILCIGVSLMAVWKLLVSVHDRREVARFEAERSKAKWQSTTKRG
ncbi:hypothetical protein NHX12_006431 [Muraenolepis orangiensis]|uniref:Integrin beta n=1 Tax=Muraenolepis orangiensis TaxID=630683 RepID=A0A9Q0ICV1_9TELE|nr:hypothetical protein NHX12_006431 [Muraenolepis orangiensis]